MALSTGRVGVPQEVSACADSTYLTPLELLVIQWKPRMNLTTWKYGRGERRRQGNASFFILLWGSICMHGTAGGVRSTIADQYGFGHGAKHVFRGDAHSRSNSGNIYGSGTSTRAHHDQIHYVNRIDTATTRPKLSISVRYLHRPLGAGDSGWGISVNHSEFLSNSHQPQT